MTPRQQPAPGQEGPQRPPAQQREQAQRYAPPAGPTPGQVGPPPMQGQNWQGPPPQGTNQRPINQPPQIPGGMGGPPPTNQQRGPVPPPLGSGVGGYSPRGPQQPMPMSPVGGRSGSYPPQNPQPLPMPMSPGGYPPRGPQGAPMPAGPGSPVGVMAPRQAMAPGQRPLEIVDGNVILYRSPHFLLRTAYRPGWRRDPLRKPTGHTRMLPKIMPQQGLRVATSETIMMPKVELSGALPDLRKQRKGIPVPRWIESFFVLVGLAISLLAHAYNMFNFPRYELDEGTYMSNAWANWQGMIQPGPYGYGHPPLAWMQIAALIPVTGGFFTFGNAINTGRVLMLLYAIGSGLLVYLIIRRLIDSRAAGLLGLVIFSLAPLAVTYQRQVYLDNVAVFWLLLSLYFVVISKSRLRYLTLAAMSLGISVLSKEVFVLFVPAMFYGVWLHTTKFQRKFAMVAFAYTTLAVISGWVLLAVLKGELFPPGWLPWDQGTHHLSFIGTFLSQAGRGQTEGSFLGSWLNWASGDWALMFGSLGAPILNMIIGWGNRKHLLLALLTVSFWLLLIRGGVVLTFYIIPLVPLIAINMAIAINAILKWFAGLFYFDFMRAVLVFFLAVAFLPYALLQGGYNYTLHPSSIQVDMLLWARSHIPRNAVVIVQGWAFTDMTVPGGQAVGDGAPFANTLVYTNVDDDPTVFLDMLQKNPDRIDYFLADSQMITYITGATNGIPGDPNDPQRQRIDQVGYHGLDGQTKGQLLMQAFFKSKLVAEFKATDHGNAADHTNEFGLQVYQVQHDAPPPVAQAPSGASANGSPSGINTNALTRGPGPIDRRSQMG